jgi:hypothetical protein
VALPGAGQIIFVFICVAAIAVGIALILRRYGPSLGILPRQPSGVVVTVLTRQRLEPGVNLQIVNVAGERLAIVTSRSGVAIHALSATGPNASPSALPEDRRG